MEKKVDMRIKELWNRCKEIKISDKALLWLIAIGVWMILLQNLGIIPIEQKVAIPSTVDTEVVNTVDVQGRVDIENTVDIIGTVEVDNTVHVTGTVDVW